MRAKDLVLNKLGVNLLLLYVVLFVCLLNVLHVVNSLFTYCGHSCCNVIFIIDTESTTGSSTSTNMSPESTGSGSNCVFPWTFGVIAGTVVVSLLI